jgi:light-regulated signal transduction histidine kinase (bacteriophytochrome)
VVITTAYGRQLPIVITSAIIDREGQEGVSFFLDISEQHAARRLVEERNSELERINAELDSFSYSVSHDLRAPLRGIEGFSRALEEDYAPQLDDDGKRYLTRIRAGTLRMGQLIDDLLQLSRVGRAELNFKPLDLSDLAGQVARQLAETSPERTVQWEIAPGLVVEGDPRLLRIALENLLGNAFKFTALRPDARIEVGQTQTPRGAAFYVRDNGSGFDMAYAGKLFTAFQRLHTQEQFSGTGIGLSIVRRIISRHAGDIWAEAALEQGATFYFTLRSEAKHGH